MDATNNFALNLVITRSFDTGKTNMLLGYTDESLGFIHLPSQAMTELAKELPYLKSLHEYKEALVTKRSRQ